MQDPNASQASERSTSEPSDPPPNDSWVRGLARPAADIEVEELYDLVCRDDQCLEIVCLALAAG